MAGKKFEDKRHSTPPEGLECNLGRMPMLSHNDSSIGQSVAIYFYVASECGLMGTNHMEGAQILNITEHLKEMSTAYYKICPYGETPTAENTTTWFDEGATDATGAADRAGYATRYLTWYMGRMEAMLPEGSSTSGFAVGSQASLADVCIFYAFAEELKTEERPEGCAEHKCVPFGDKSKMDSKLKNYPKIEAICKQIATNAAIVEWKANRGVQGF